jgi:ubiquinone biosynthesis protein
MSAVSSSLHLLHAVWLLVGPAHALRAKKPDAGARLSRALERLGPAYIKLGQMLATRPDIVGIEIAEALEHLQDRLPPFSDFEARAEITRAFGKPVEALFSSFGGAMAAASIAQVHRAQTSDTPPVRVAVKVLRPKVREQFARDLEALAFFARLGERFSAEARRLRFTAVVATLAESVALELDL